MTIREAQKEQRKSIKNRSAKEKLSYFWEYHGIKTICLVIAAAALLSFLIGILTKKDYAFTGVFFGAVPQSASDSYVEQFARDTGIDLSEYQLFVRCHPDVQMEQQITPDIYQSMEAFTAMVAAKSVDCYAGNDELFLYYAYMEYALDLRTVFTAEELAALAPYLHYIDGKLIAQQEIANEGYADAYSQHPDSTKPETMEDPIPVGISFQTATDDFRANYQINENMVIGICANSEHSQNAAAFLRYCLDCI